MRKVVAGINLTIDGFCDHTAVSPDQEIHQHYTDLLHDSGVILYGRKTYELMQFWQPFLSNPSGDKTMDDFAVAIDNIPKIVFSHTLKKSDPMITGWKSASLSSQTLQEAVIELKNTGGNDILIGSRSLIVALTNLKLIDEYQLCIHPVLAGKGLSLFDQLNERTVLQLIKTKIFKSGAMLLCYNPI